MQLDRHIQEAMGRITQWWEGKLTERAALSFSIPKGIEKKYPPSNELWPSLKEEPDLENFTNSVIEDLHSRIYFGEAIPAFPHLYGGRGTPMTIGGYLGAPLEFKGGTVWQEETIKDWDKFEFQFNPENKWWKLSKNLFQLACEKSQGEYLPCLPDFGDAMTILSLIRGGNNLLVDVIDVRDKVLAARDRIVELWPQFHQEMWKIYSAKFPRDCSWLIWAPGKTYALQCDFSVSISPQMFKDFAVPEIERLGNYLEYIVWHLDSPGEIKHLDILLDLPQIKAIQWVPGAGNPPAVEWIPMLRKIQEKGRSLIVYAYNEPEVQKLIKELDPRSLYIADGFTGNSEQEALSFIDRVSELSQSRLKEL